MKRHFPVLLVALAAIFMMACNFTSKLNVTPTPNDQNQPLEQDVTVVEPLATVARPQTAFIDGRDQPEGSVVSVQPQTQLLSQSGSGASSGSYASGGSYPSGGSGNWNCCQPPPPQCFPRTDWTFTYVVQRGDTLGRIAQAAGVSVQVLAQGNCIANPNIIFVGQVLRVPCFIPPPPPPPPCCQPPPCCFPPPIHPTFQPPVIIPTVPPVQPPVIIGTALTITPFDSVNNNTFILPPDTLITISWPAAFPAATDRVVFELIPPGMGSGDPIGIDTNLGDGASIIWNSVNGTQGTVRAVAHFTGGFAPQISDFYYVIAGMP